jgi:hypothetical protein
VAYDPKLMLSACAEPGNGKTEFGCSGTGEIAFFSVDSNTREIVEESMKRQGRSDIELKEYVMPPVMFGDAFEDQGREDIKARATEVLAQFADDVKPIVRRELRRMPSHVVIDTATEFYELALLADHGRAVQLLPELRTKTNYKWKSFLQALKNSGCHVTLLHLLGPRYEDVKTRVQGGGEKMERVKVPGEYDRRGFSGTSKEVGAEIHIYRDTARDPDLEKQFGIKIVKCNIRPLLVGRDYWGVKRGMRVASFNYVASKVYPQATWE